ncbi:MAG: ABC transporter substrate-binding protein [Ignavibacteria bacterium]|jgi:hypothetical protein
MINNYVKQGCINIYVSLPCPLKVPFKQMFDSFLESWNSDSTKQPIYMPLTTDCSPEGFEELAISAKSEDDLPDIHVTSSYRILFSEPFYGRFMKPGIYTGFPKEMYGDSYPQNVIEAAEKFHVGFLGFSSWGVIHDSKFNGQHPIPTSWSELTESRYKDLISIHGCHGQAGNISMLMNIKKAGGIPAIEKLAENVKKVEHFSKLIKELGSNKKSGTPFYILPNVAIANIPSTKRAELLSMEESIISPLMIIVKRSKTEQSMELLKFFSSGKFKKMLAGHSYFQPSDIEGIEVHKFEHMEIFVKESYKKIYNEANHLFVTALGEKIPQN